jgi:hypothetical protein
LNPAFVKPKPNPYKSWDDPDDFGEYVFVDKQRSIVVNLMIPEASESVAGATKLSILRFVLANWMNDENSLAHHGGFKLDIARDNQGIVLRAHQHHIYKKSVG